MRFVGLTITHILLGTYGAIGVGAGIMGWTGIVLSFHDARSPIAGAIYLGVLGAIVALTVGPFAATASWMVSCVFSRNTSLKWALSSAAGISVAVLAYLHERQSPPDIGSAGWHVFQGFLLGAVALAGPLVPLLVIRRTPAS